MSVLQMKRPSQCCRAMAGPDHNDQQRRSSMANSSLPRNHFQKRHYEAIALAMQDARFRLRSSSLDQWQCTIQCLANMLAEDNGRFQRERVISACERGANVRARNGGAR